MGESDSESDALESELRTFFSFSFFGFFLVSAISLSSVSSLPSEPEIELGLVEEFRMIVPSRSIFFFSFASSDSTLLSAVYDIEKKSANK